MIGKPPLPVMSVERRRGLGVVGDNSKRIFLVFCWMALASALVGSSADAQREGVAERKREHIRQKDQQTLRTKSTIRPGGGELENICEVESSLSAYCLCDSLTLHDANDARCTVFNITDQNDPIWESFRTQPGIHELQLNVHEDGRLNFVPTSVFRYLPNLTSLQVRDGSIDTLSSHIFADALHLQELRLNRNKIRLLRPYAFQGQSNIVELELSQNAIGSLERGAFMGLDNLQVLLLDGNNISLVEDSVFLPLRHLQELDLSDNHIGVLTGETLLGLQLLKKLFLRGNQVAILGDQTFKFAPNIRRLDLSSNQIQVIRHQALAGLHRLDNLNLAKNQLATLEKSALHPVWSNLMNATTQLSMEGNPLKCDCRLLWLGDLRSSASEAVRAGLGQLQCTFADGQSAATNLMDILATSDCQSTTTSTTKRPLRTSTTTPRTTVAYVLEDEPAVSTKQQEQQRQPALVNDSGASLQLSSDSKSIQEPTTSDTSTLSSNHGGRSSAEKVGKEGPLLLFATVVAWLLAAL